MNFLIPDKEPKMTETEIMKALECHKERDVKSCGRCPLLNIDGCVYKLSENALDLINRKNAENAEKDAEIEKLAYKLECLLCTVTGSKLSKSTYSLKTMECYANDFLQECCEEAENEARAEAIKEFAERVKKLIVMCYYDLGDLEDTMLLEKDIDQIAKEMGVEL